jgi:putative FmdB family regulatory protein
MPIYEYACDDFGKRYEQIVLSRSQEVVCPGCSSKRNTAFLRGLQVQPAPVQLSVFNARVGSSGNGSSISAEAAPGGSCACGMGGCGRN